MSERQQLAKESEPFFTHGCLLFTFGVNFAPLVHYIIAGDGMALIAHQTRPVGKTE